MVGIEILMIFFVHLDKCWEGQRAWQKLFGSFHAVSAKIFKLIQCGHASSVALCPGLGFEAMRLGLGHLDPQTLLTTCVSLVVVKG